MRKRRIRIRVKKQSRRRDEPRAEVEIPRQVNPRTKKKLADSAELLREIENLLQEAAAKIQKTERLVLPFRCRPQVPNCEGRMMDLR